QNPLVHALVMAAQENQILFLRELLRHGLMKDRSLGRHINSPGLTPEPLCHRLPRLIDRLRLHDHAGSAAIRVVVYLAMFISRVIADVDGFQTNGTFFDGPSGNTRPEAV